MARVVSTEPTRMIKMCDVTDNRERLGELGKLDRPTADRLEKKYLRACEIIQEAEESSRT